MKRQRHIRTHVLLTMITLTCGILLAVVLTFNLSIRGYIRSRVSAQLSAVTENASEAWRDDGMHGKGQEPGRFDERPDRELTHLLISCAPPRAPQARAALTVSVSL